MERVETKKEGRKWISQYWMGATQLAFIKIMILYPEKVGLGHLVRKDFEGIIHYWRVIGYLLGISDEFNACSKPLDEFRAFTRELQVKETHANMLKATEGMRSLGQGIIDSIFSLIPRRIIPLTYPAFMKYFTEAIELDFDCEMTFRDKISYYCFDFLFNGPVLKSTLLRRLINKLLIKRFDDVTEKQIQSIDDSILEGFHSDAPSTCPFQSTATRLKTVEVSDARSVPTDRCVVMIV